MIDLDRFFDSPRDVAMATNFMAKFGYMNCSVEQLSETD